MKTHESNVIPLAKYKKHHKISTTEFDYSLTKRIFMFRKSIIFLLLGIVWLFIFSIPVGSHGKKLYSIAYFYIVDTKVVHVVTNLIFNTASETTNSASHIMNDVVSKVEQEQPKKLK